MNLSEECFGKKVRITRAWKDTGIEWFVPFRRKGDSFFGITKHRDQIVEDSWWGIDQWEYYVDEEAQFEKDVKEFDRCFGSAESLRFLDNRYAKKSA